MSKQKEGKKKSDKSLPTKTVKEKKAEKHLKKIDKLKGDDKINA